MAPLAPWHLPTGLAFGGSRRWGGLWRGGSSLVCCRVQHGAGCSPQHPKDALSKATPLFPTPHRWVPTCQDKKPSQAKPPEPRLNPSPPHSRSGRKLHAQTPGGHTRFGLQLAYGM
ncbi:unnamed protein product [Rangifer tarandus platyrhynchus]|uniref:Uncharacterized protein n=1 Tax=Rangifer tarandus platyrhynchus TaxID=3082113 RepID=A0AC59ZHQ3_RANTA